MTLHIISDTHFEMMSETLRTRWWNEWEVHCRAGADAGATLVLAGDIDKPSLGLNLTLDDFMDRYEKVVYVPGNHEYHGSSFTDCTKYFAAIKRNLNRRSNGKNRFHLITPGKRFGDFIGGTMWYPPTDPNYEDSFIDFWNITDARPKIANANQAFNAKVPSMIRPGNIIVTHHLPFKESIAPQWKGSPTNDFFLNKALPGVSTAAKLWIHGHTHNPVDYHLGNMRVYANPYGYFREGSNPDFWQRVEVEV